MARSRGGRARGRSTRRNVDWVVLDATYSIVPYVLPNNSIVFAPLTLPEQEASYVDPTLAVPFPRHWWPEQDSGQVAYAVRGDLEVIPSNWAAGSIYRMAMRIAKFPVEWGALFNALNDPSYSLYSDLYANSRFLWERKLTGLFTLGGQMENIHINWKGTCKLDQNEALFLILENQSGITSDVQVRPYLRTLMRANG